MGSLMIISLHNHCWGRGWKKIWKLVNICWSYEQLSTGSFYMKCGVYVMCMHHWMLRWEGGSFFRMPRIPSSVATSVLLQHCRMTSILPTAEVNPLSHGVATPVSWFWTMSAVLKWTEELTVLAHQTSF